MIDPALYPSIVMGIGCLGICAGVIRWAQQQVCAERKWTGVVMRSHDCWLARAEAAEAKLAAMSKRDPVTGRFAKRGR